MSQNTFLQVAVAVILLNVALGRLGPAATLEVGPAKRFARIERGQRQGPGWGYDPRLSSPRPPALREDGGPCPQAAIGLPGGS